MPTSYSAACHGHRRHPSSVTRPLPSEAKRWRQRLETANGLPALIPTARAPCGVFSTTTTCEPPRSSTATSRAVDCSTLSPAHYPTQATGARPYHRPDHKGPSLQASPARGPLPPSAARHDRREGPRHRAGCSQRLGWVLLNECLTRTGSRLRRSRSPTECTRDGSSRKGRVRAPIAPRRFKLHTHQLAAAAA